MSMTSETPATIDDKAADLRELWNEQAEFSQRAFGADGVRGPQGPIKHLQKECDEILAEPGDIAEYADAGLLFLDATRRAGFTLPQIVEAMHAKLDVNKARSWPKPTSNDEPVFHSAPQPPPTPEKAEDFSHVTLSDGTRKEVRNSSGRAARLDSAGVFFEHGGKLLFVDAKQIDAYDSEHPDWADLYPRRAPTDPRIVAQIERHIKANPPPVVPPAADPPHLIDVDGEKYELRARPCNANGPEFGVYYRYDDTLWCCHPDGKFVVKSISPDTEWGLCIPITARRSDACLNALRAHIRKANAEKQAAPLAASAPSGVVSNDREPPAPASSGPPDANKWDEPKAPPLEMFHDPATGQPLFRHREVASTAPPATAVLSGAAASGGAEIDAAVQELRRQQVQAPIFGHGAVYGVLVRLIELHRAELAQDRAATGGTT